ncbi:outer membrane lipoprotein carrier protein LolA [Thermodesulfobacteriota bacterium]
MPRYRTIHFSILFLLLTSSGVFGDEPDTSIDHDRTESILLRIKEASSEIVTLTGDFVQKKKIEILKDMPDSKGKLYYKKPDCLRWEVIEPVNMGFVVNGKQGKKWRGESGKPRRFDVRKEPIIGVISNQVFAWAEGDFDNLKAGYEIILMNEEPVEIKLLPLSSMEKKYIESIILTFSETENYVERIEINEKKGGCTQIVFDNMVINASLDEDIF